MKLGRNIEEVETYAILTNQVSRIFFEFFMIFLVKVTCSNLDKVGNKPH